MGKLSKWLLGIEPQKAFDTISNGVDKLAFTEEERSELNMMLADKVAEFAEKTLSENTIRSKTRRFIAILVVINTLILVMLSIVFKLMNIDITFIFEIADKFYLGSVFVTVIVFHFGGYIIGGLNMGKKKK